VSTEAKLEIFAALYLVASILFVLGLKGLSSPKTAIRGNQFSMAGMTLAIVTTFFHPDIKTSAWIWAGLLGGAAVGVPLAQRIQMTAMPQLVAALHSFVGLAAVCIAAGTFYGFIGEGDGISRGMLVEIGIGGFIGAITYSGSLIAFGKLQEILGSSPLVFRFQHWVNLTLAVVMIGLCAWFTVAVDPMAFWLMIVVALLLGVLLVLPIGGADMPVVVSMLNSYSGWAAAATGFTLNNPLLITTGALVGSSGAILSYIMCKAMNRSIVSVVLGGFGTEVSAKATDGAQKSIRSSPIEDAAFMLENASKVIIVPGYGMAVAQAQHSMKELVHTLTEKGIEVKFAIHPVAGRMPGHMNVLLAESDIPYDIVHEMEDINSEFSGADVALVVGANDVINPAAKTDKTSPLYGMPILDAYKAKQVFVIKRSMKAGYAGVDNELFYYENCSLVFGDAKAVCEGLVKSVSVQ
jgi:NAD(P) transhydrogenase subunit beta